MDEIIIRCPKCNWEPRQKDRWMCSCGHVWNTFDTGGRCPSCSKVWEDTQCLSCNQWSPHLDWYENLGDVADILKESLSKPATANIQTTQT